MHREALAREAKYIFPLLSEFRGFYLAGGTALALQLGHRVSVDFDLFSVKPIPKNFLRRVEGVFTDKKVRLLVNNRDELTFLVKGTKLTFLYYPFRLLFPARHLEGLKVASAKDIAVMKAYTIGRRGSFKDYADMYFILRKRALSLDGICKYATKKYGDGFDPRLFLEQLVYFGDLRDTKITFLKATPTVATIKKFFEAEVRKITL